MPIKNPQNKHQKKVECSAANKQSKIMLFRLIIRATQIE